MAGSVVAAQPWHGRGQAHGPFVFMFGRPPHALRVQAGQLPVGDFPAS